MDYYGLIVFRFLEITLVDRNWASLVAWLIKNLPAMWETWVPSLNWEDPLEKSKATHSSFWPGVFNGLFHFHFLLTEANGVASRCHSGKESTCQFRRCKRHGFDPRVGRIPWRRKWLPTPLVLPGKSHGQRSLAGYSPWGRKESDMTERLSTHTVGRGLDAKRCFQYHCALWPGTYSIYCPSPLSLLLEKSREARLA